MDKEAAITRLEQRLVSERHVDGEFADIVSAAAVRVKEESKSPEPASEPVDSIDKQPEQAALIRYDFEDPLELAQILTPAVKFYPWQDKLARQLGSVRPTNKDPFKLCLTACNGSGKDAFVITPFVIWFMLTRINGLVVVTSSSGTQLTSQTENHIQRMAFAFNAWIGRDVFKVIKRFLKCTETGSECRLFATDEPGKAEGYHPLTVDGEMAVIANEVKSIPDEMMAALSRCSGYNFWLEVSTPGEPAGHFYYSNNTYENKIHVTSYDCLGHKSLKEIEADKLRYGEHSATFRSMHLALFTQVGGMFICSQLALDRCVATCTAWVGKRWPKRVGIDVALSNGGDETIVCITQGNKRLSQLVLHSEDITTLAHDIDKFLRAEGISLNSETIFLDDGGVGRALWPLLQAKGWTAINRILNQFRAFNNAEFANRGTELNFLAARLIEENLLLLPTDDKLFMQQIVSRKYKRSSVGGKMLAESKKEMKAEGRKSPDRWEAFLLSLHGLSVENFLEAVRLGDATETLAKPTHAARVLTHRELTRNGQPRETVEAGVDFNEFFGLSGSGKSTAAHNITNTIGQLSRLSQL